MATRKPSAEPKRGRGQPSSYRPEFATQARKLCALGATDETLADFFGVTTRTILRWKDAHADFCLALKDAKADLDSQVERRLFERAMGYTHPEDDIRAVNGQIIITPTIKHYPPDTVAAIFWLKNRRPDRWRQQPAEGGDETPPAAVPVTRQNASIPEPG